MVKKGVTFFLLWSETYSEFVEIRKEKTTSQKGNRTRELNIKGKQKKELDFLRTSFYTAKKMLWRGDQKTLVDKGNENDKKKEEWVSVCVCVCVLCVCVCVRERERERERENGGETKKF